MDRIDRNTLKSYFQKGDIPTEQQFAELIDSVPNIKDDGQVVRTENGWAFYPPKGGKMCIKFYTEEHVAQDEKSAWTFAVASDSKTLTLLNDEEEAVLGIHHDKSVTLYGSLTVENEITASGYQRKDGGETDPDPQDYREIKADKQWTDLIEVPSEHCGSRVYIVFALFRDRDLGVCKLTRATAICLNALEQWIESPRKHWWGWSGRVRFRWQEKDGKTCLQVRSKRHFYSGQIYCRIMEMFKG